MPEEPTNQKSQYLKRDEIRTMEKDIAHLRELESEATREKIAEIKTGEEAVKEADRLDQSRQATQERENLEAETEKKEEELERLKTERAASALDEIGVTAAKAEEEKESLRVRLKEAQLKEEESRKKFLENVAAKAEKTFQFPKPKLPSIPMPKVEGYFPAKSPLFEKIWIRVIVSLLVLAILAAIGTFWYWYLVIKEKPLQTELPAKTAEKTAEETLPLALITTENNVTIEIAAVADLPESLSRVLKSDLGTNKFTRILIKNTRENKFLGLKEFFEAFQVKTPENFYNNADDNFTLFVFSTPLKNQLGLIAKTENQAVLRSIAASWEQTIEGDTNNLFVFLGKKGTKNPLFQEFTHKGTDVRYLSFTEENFGIVWAITDNYFIFTSSGESIVKVIDKIK